MSNQEYQEKQGLGKPSPSRQSAVSKEPYTPSWMSPKERSKLKARIVKMKNKEGSWRMKKEEGILVQKSLTPSPIREPEAPKAEEDPGGQLGPQPSVISKDPSKEPSGLTPIGSSTPKKSADETKKSKKPNKDSKESVSKKKSKESVSKKKSKENVSKKKSKEELAMAKKPKDQKSKHSKAVYANPTGNRVEDEEPWIPHPRDTIEAHLWATDFRHFDPQLYAFKTPEKLSTKKPVVAECPPFWVLNDHTIAVAWKLYCKEADRSDLGIVALQWSREFVSAMKDERGEYPNAIKHLLDAIEDGLIFRYSRADEDSKKAHHKEDDISYASSDSVFKQPTEVSYTLKDIMSRNFPGRKFGDDHEASTTTVRKDTNNASAVSKSFVNVDEDGPVDQKDLIALLKQCKIEQEARIKHEMTTSKEIERLLKQAEDGKLPITQGERRKHLDFDMPDESEPLMESSKKKHDADLKKSASTASNKSAKSNASAKSAASDKSMKSSKSRDSMSSAGSNYDTTSDNEMAKPDAKAEAKAMKKKRSTDSAARKQSKDSVAKKQSKDSVAKKKSSDSVAKKKSTDSVARKQSKGSASSQKSGKGEAKGKKRSGSSEKKGSKGSK